MKYVQVQTVPRDGLGFPVVPLLIAGGSAAASLFARKKKGKVSEADAKKAVQQVYLELLERDPWNPYDKGAEGYVRCLVEGWCDVDFVRTEVLQSPEWRERETRRAARTYGAAASGPETFVQAGGVQVDTGFIPPPASAGIPSTVGGIPIVLLVGGLALVMLLRR